MIRTDKKELCSGCGTCALVCPRNCISFSKDVLGSPVAEVDDQLCINCGACESVCPIQQSFENKRVGCNAYAVFSNDNSIRFRGSSGGVFETVADYILSKGGSVFASGFSNELKLCMKEAKTLDEVRNLTKSKYLQSDVVGCFPIIKERIQQGVYVLVCSTPCHVSALKKYLGKLAEMERLVLLDFFCHGVPSQQLFDQNIAYLEKRDGVKITEYEFRTKIKNGATPHYYSLSYVKNGCYEKKTSLYFKDPFYLGFQKYITLRDSCYNCPYGYGNHEADITIGDFHDIDKYISGINRFEGISTVIINGDRGREIFEKIRESLCIYEMNIEQLYADHQIYSGGTSKPNNREDFLGDMETKTFDYIVNKWFNPKHEWKKNVYYHMPLFVRKILKSVLVKE